MATIESDSDRTLRRRAAIERRRAERRASGSRALSARALPNWELLIPALIGVALASYLSVIAWWGGTPLACGIGSDCDAVQGSRFASLFGVPVAAWGALAYVALAGIAWRIPSARWHGILALTVSGPALAMSLYLTAISLFVVRATCAWCIASLLLVLACFIASLRALPTDQRKLPRSLAPAAVASLLVIGVVHLQFQSDLTTGPEDPRLRALALHLADSGAVFYGASWCNHCQEQKAVFGGAAHRLPYVECSPNGRGTAAASACRDAGVNVYPTWIVVGQRFEGLVPPDRLAELSGFGENGGNDSGS